MKYQYLPDPETGYCEDEAGYLDYLHEIEVEEQYRAAHLVANEEPSGVDPETGCTAAEMKEEELPDWMSDERSKQ
jgi:hypothetical protein